MQQDISEINREESTTHNCYGNLEADVETGKVEYVYNFGFNLDFQFLVNKHDMMKRGPVLVFEVCTINSWGNFS